MRPLPLTLLGVLPLLVACGSSVQQTNTGGNAGSGGAATTASSSSSSSTSSSGSTTGGAGGTGGKPDNGMPSTDYPAPFPVPPHVINYGGPVLKAPKIVPIFFAGDDADIVAKATDFAAKIGSTQYWAATTSEYGVGPATSPGAVNLTETAPTSITDDGIQTWLTGKLNADDPAFPPGDENTVYVIHYPAGTNISLQGQQSCQSFGGYHSNVALDAAHGGINVAYAVIPRCQNFGGMTGIDAVTATESHELVEAATDPYPMTDPAWAIMDDAHIFWLRILGGGENGDMCAQFSESFTTFAELPYMVQRAWSNKAADAGHDPCVPALPGEVYFNAAPRLTEWVTYTIQGQSVPVKGVKIALNESKTIDLDLFSDGDTGGPWDVEAQDVSALFGGPPRLDFSLDRTSGQNGEKLHLTITVTEEGKNKTESFVVISSQGGTRHAWFGVVGNP